MDGDQLAALTERRERLAAELAAARAETERLRRRNEQLRRTRPEGWPPERIADRLLHWAEEAGGRQAALADWPLAAELPPGAVWRAVLDLVRDGFAEAGPAPAECRLTPAGRQEAARRREVAGSRRERLAHAERALLAWAHERADDGPLRLAEFGYTAGAWLYGSELSLLEVREAVARLAALGLLAEQDGGARTVRLTAAGHEHVRSGRPIGEGEETMTTNNHYTFNQTVNGGTAAQGPNIVQNIGLGPADLATLLQGLRQAAPAVAEPYREAFLGDVAVVEDTSRPDEERLGAWQRIKGLLTTVGSGVAANGLIELGSRVFSG